MTLIPRLRFAPSPTGHLHVGGARTALYNWLIAKKLNGVFVLRVEDTDRERSTEEYVQSILEAMKWLKLEWQEGPFFQTDRLEVYRSHLEDLLLKEKAYRCYCTTEDLELKRQQALSEGRKPKYDGTCREISPLKWKEDLRPFCIRFKSPNSGSTIVHDLIRGKIEFQNSELDDLIIWRTDGTPTYNFCVVVDDVTMKITHVIRGDDHLNNSPRQILLYQAFDYEVPIFAHVPMILGADKARLSKRHGATSVLAYREMGYLPDALLNYLTRLGWSSGDKEIFSRDELIDAFTLEAVGKSPGVFNPEKLLWLNGIYIRQSNPSDLLEEVERIASKKGYSPLPRDLLIEAIQVSLEKVKTLVELVEFIDFLYFDEFEFDSAAQKVLQSSLSNTILQEVVVVLKSLSSFEKLSLKEGFEKIVLALGIKLKELAQPIRVALCGKTVSPGIYEMILLLGKEKTIDRIQKVIDNQRSAESGV